MSFTREQIEAELKARGVNVPSGAGAPSAPSDGGLLQNGDTTNSFGFMSHPIANTMKGVHAAQDFAGGLMGGVQKGAAFLTKPIEYATHAAYEGITGNKVPHYNTGELFGVGGDNPVDLNKAISNNPDSFMSTMGKYAPAMAAGGASIPGQMVANGLWGAVQADPQQENLGGILPSGRVGAGIEDAALAGTVGAAAKYGPGLIKSGANQVKKAWDYIHPDQDAAAFLKTLGSGTKEANAQSLAKDIQMAHQNNLQDALSHKEPIYQQEAKTDIYKTPDTALPEGNLDIMAHYIAPGEKTSATQLEALSKEIKAFRSGKPDKAGNPTYDFDDFTHNVQEIFGSDMNQTQIDNLEHALNIPVSSDSKFLTMAKNNDKIIEGNTRDLYDKFVKKPTLSNADALQSQLGDDYGYYKGLQEKGKLEPALKPRLKQLSDLRNQLKDEMTEGLNRRNPNYGKELDQYNQKYRENVVPYGQEQFTQNIVGEGKKVREERAANPNLPYNVTSGEAASYFANPSRSALKVSEDIGEAGRNKILYNLLADETNPEAKGLANAILSAKQSKGYSRYITPEMEDLAQQLLRRTKWRERTGNAVKWGSGIAGVAGLEEAIRRNL